MLLECTLPANIVTLLAGLPPVRDYSLPIQGSSTRQVFNGGSDGTIPAGVTVSSLFGEAAYQPMRPELHTSRSSSNGYHSPPDARKNSYEISGSSLPHTPDLVGSSSNAIQAQANGTSAFSQPSGLPEAGGIAPTAAGTTALPDPDSLFASDWPASLPSPKLVYSLLEIFFSKKFMFSSLINAEKFYGHLSLGPSHQDFPHVALLHSMCAVATTFVATQSAVQEGELA